MSHQMSKEFQLFFPPALAIADTDEAIVELAHARRHRANLSNDGKPSQKPAAILPMANPFTSTATNLPSLTPPLAPENFEIIRKLEI